jgi:uncharacterized cofD-like protein
VTTPARAQSIVLIGGGTGSPQLLVSLRRAVPGSNLSIVVPVTDTGRSTGVVRRTLHIPGPGDLRHCLTTLAGADSEWGVLLERRMSASDHPDLDGMAAGNLLLGALAQQTGDIGLATEQLARLLGVHERVLPVSVENIHLGAILADGAHVSGELEVRRPGKPPITELYIEGARQGIWEPARNVLEAADALVIGPGSLWTSIGGVLAVPGVRDALRRSKARVVFICNTTTQPGQTDGLDLWGHIQVAAKLVGRYPDIVIANNGRPQPGEECALEREGLVMLVPDQSSIGRAEAQGTEIVARDLLVGAGGKSELWQKLHTAYHDMDKTAAVIAGLIQ